MYKILEFLSIPLRIINTTFGGFSSWFEKPKTTYTAEFHASAELSRFNHGIAVTGAKAGTLLLAHENTAVFGPTGSGKSSSIIYSSAISLARGKSSIVFNDLNGECHAKLSGFFAKAGYEIFVFDPRNPHQSETFNFLEFIHADSDIYSCSQLIHLNVEGEAKGDKFFQNASIMLCALFMRYLYHYDKEHLTMQNVLLMVERFSYDPAAVSRLFARTGDEELISSFKSTLSMTDKTLSSVVSSLRVVLNLWQDKEICKTTSSNSIDLNLLRKKPTVIFLRTSIKDLNYTKPITALFFQTLFNFVLDHIPSKKESTRSIIFMFDEFASYALPDAAMVISVIRKHAGGLVLCMQDEQALTGRYGAAVGHQIKTNCGTQIYLKGQPLSTCKELSQILGRYTYTTEKGEKVRELLTPDEIRQEERAIILIKNSPPLREVMVPYFKNVWLSHLIDLPPYQLPSKPDYTPALIRFDEK
ncbi:MAG: type IV secretory system conjugative DNA transfer family protein [Bacteroidetes bacterium]|nr:type IV secretory system conjugative DNA transfer family protein [Bacteroidota bacterium]